MDKQNSINSKIIYSVILLVVILLVVLIGGFAGFYFVFDSNISTDSVAQQSQEKTIKSTDTGYEITSPLLNEEVNYITGEDLDAGIYNVYFSGDDVDSNFSLIKGSQLPYYNEIDASNTDDNGLLYYNLTLSDTDVITFKVNDGCKFILESVTDYNEFDPNIMGQYSLEQGNYSLTINEIDKIKVLNEFRVYSFDENYITIYSFKRNGDDLYFTTTEYDIDSLKVNNVENALVDENNINVNLQLSEDNYFYYDPNNFLTDFNDVVELQKLRN